MKRARVELLPLTSLRFFLASWIVILHLDTALSPATVFGIPATSAAHNIVRCGYIGVGVFFLLSGFILALNYPLDSTWNTVTVKKFAVARFSRIYPVYFLGLVSIAPVVLIPSILEHSRSLFIRRSFSGFLNGVLLQAWVPRTAITWNGPGWSLSNEAFFYLCFPVLGVWLFRRLSWRRFMAGLIGFLVLELAVPVLCIVKVAPGFSDLPATGEPGTLLAYFAMFNPLLNLPFFLYGILAYWCFSRLEESDSILCGRGYILYIPSILALLVMTSLGNHIPYPLMHGGLTLIPALGIVIGFALGDKYLCVLMSNRTLVFMGKASYAEYLLHAPVRIAFESIGLTWTPTLTVTYCVIVLIVSALVFHFFEEPLQRKIRKWMLAKERSRIDGVKVEVSS